jgi:hypothetical protein
MRGVLDRRESQLRAVPSAVPETLASRDPRALIRPFPIQEGQRPGRVDTEAALAVSYSLLTRVPT